MPTLIACDACDPTPTVKLMQIVMREGTQTATRYLGGGDTQGDRLVVNDKIYVRAECSGKSTGRTYTLTY